MAASNTTTSQTTKQLQELDAIEEDLVESLASAGMALKEITRDKVNNKLLDQYTSTFTNRLERAGSGLSQQISYLIRVSTSQSAESSSYGCRKDSHMAQTRLKHAQARLQGLSSSLAEDKTVTKVDAATAVAIAAATSATAAPPQAATPSGNMGLSGLEMGSGSHGPITSFTQTSGTGS